LFFFVNLLLGVGAVAQGVRVHLAATGHWDAGALWFFVAFWCFFAAAGFHRRDPGWVVMGALPLAGLAGLVLFIGVLSDWSPAAGLGSSGSRSLLAGVGLGSVQLAGVVYALWARGRSGE
jgi:hypothetical protein